jgi:hypothetical protein
MNALSELHGCETPIPDGWAVWRVTPSMYDPQAGDAKGGTLYKCLKSPPMLDFDAHGKCYAPQDASDTLLVIDCKSEAAGKQLKIPWPFSPRGDHATGPAVGTAPDGSIWISQLGSYNALVRIDPTRTGRPAPRLAEDGAPPAQRRRLSDEDERVLYEFGGPAWCKSIRLIHLAFSPKVMTST